MSEEATDLNAATDDALLLSAVKQTYLKVCDLRDNGVISFDNGHIHASEELWKKKLFSLVDAPVTIEKSAPYLHLSFEDEDGIKWLTLI